MRWRRPRRAVLVLLGDERAQGDGEWAEAVRNWEDARIRKVVRRARGAEWRRAEALPGITVTSKSAEVRVYPPIPLDGWPKELAKLQVSGTELDDPEPPVPAHPGRRPGALAQPRPGHVGRQGDGPGRPRCPTGLVGPAGPARTAWRDAGYALAVRTADPSDWPRLTTSGLPVVRDAGFTEIAPGSCTVVADHPALHRAARPAH